MFSNCVNGKQFLSLLETLVLKELLILKDIIIKLNINKPNTTSGFTKKHEYLLIGAIPGAKNTITLHINNKNNQEIDTLSWSHRIY